MIDNKYSIGWVIAEKWPYRSVMASTRIRCFDIIKYLKSNGIKTGLYNSFKRYDAVIFQKVFYDEHLKMARKLKSQGTSIVLDLNVNYFEKIGETTQVTEEQIKALHNFLKLTDKIIVSSPNLKDIAGKYHSDVRYIPEQISTIGSYSPMEISEPVKLIYCGYAVKADCILLIEDVLERLAEDYHMECIFICDKDPGLKLPVKSSFIKYEQKNLSRLLRQGNIKIAPRKLDNSYDLGHSFTKIGYPMSVGLPVVASPLPSYKGSPALLAESKEEWIGHISSLINNPDEYKNLSIKGISYVRDNFSLEKVGKMYLDFFPIAIHA